MDLCNDEEHDLKEILNHMKMPFGNGQTNLNLLKSILCVYLSKCYVKMIR